MKYIYSMQDPLDSVKVFLLLSVDLWNGHSLPLASPVLTSSFIWCSLSLDSSSFSALGLLNSTHFHGAVISKIAHVSSFPKRTDLLNGQL